MKQITQLCTRAALAVLLVGSAWGCSPQPPAETGSEQARQRPNIIFIFSDDHAYQALGAYGGPLAALNPTPNLDRLAREGMLFRNAFVTNSICAPSRAVVLTGKYSHLNGVRDNAERFDSSQVTFPKLLQQAGYQTAMIGKWHLKSNPTGFDHWAVLPGQGDYYNPDFITPQGTVRDTGYVTNIIGDRTLDWLRNQRDPSRPFALMFWHKAPHRAWEPGPEHLNLYDDIQVPEPATLFDDYSGRASPAANQEMTIAEHMNWGYDLKVPGMKETYATRIGDYPTRLKERMTPEQHAAWKAAYDSENEAMKRANLQGKDLVRWRYQRYIKDYLRSVRSVDDQVGRLLAYLEESGLADNTIIVYSSDQGFYLGEHGWYDKRWMYEESLRTPLIVRWPGVVRPGSENRDMVMNLDYAQTFLDLAGVSAPEEMQGRSLEPLLQGQTPADWRDEIYYHYYEFPAVHSVRAHEGVRTDRYKLIHYYKSGEWELFDLEKDPKELRSVYSDPAYAKVRAELEAKLPELRAKYQVPTPDATATG